MEQKKSMRESWSSNAGFILATAGSAVGLGNIWKFPYLASENGGSAFILVYLFFVVLLLPLMTSEIILGRLGQGSPVHAMKFITRMAGVPRVWTAIGWLGMIASFCILSYYSVIAGWTFFYVEHSVGGHLYKNLTAAAAEEIFSSLQSNTSRLIFWHSLAMLIVAIIAAGGIRTGIERSIRLFMPLLFFLLILLLFYSMVQGAFAESVTYMFVFDASKLSAHGVLAALGQAFFSLSIGFGCIMVYGSYLGRHIRLDRAVAYIAGIDTAIAIVAGLTVFSLVFQFGASPEQGPGLVFKTMPLIFNQLPFGVGFSVLFFVLLALAAITSMLSLLEPSVAWMYEHFHVRRPAAAFIIAFFVWLLGFGTVISFAAPESVTVAGKTFFEWLDHTVSNIMLPIVGFLLAIFSAWVIPKYLLKQEAGTMSPVVYQPMHFLLRYVTPLVIFIILIADAFMI